MSVALLLAYLLQTGELPRYRFEPGLQLNYSFKIVNSNKADDKNKKADTDNTTQITVLGKNADGSFSVLILNKMGTAPRYFWDVRMVDMLTDGRIVKESDAANGFMASLLPLLPNDNTGSWTARHERDQVICTYKTLPGKEGKYLIHEDRQGGMLGIYDAEASYDYTFDWKDGIITSITSDRLKNNDPEHVPYKYSGGNSARQLVQLESKNLLPANKLKELVEQAELLVKLKADELTVYKEGGKSTEAEAVKMMQANEARWKQANPKFSAPGLKQMADDGLKTSAMYVKYVSENAKRRAEILGKEAPAWEARDFEGRDYSSEKLRGFPDCAILLRPPS